MALAAVLATAGMLSSCSNDDLETITVKRSGTLQLTIKEGETPVADSKIEFYSADSDEKLDVYRTDANGFIDLGRLNEGTYVVFLEIKSPKYIRIRQEVQVISDQATNKTLQLQDYVGDVVIDLRDNRSEEIVKEDIGVGFAFVPENSAFEDARTNDERIALASEIKYFGTAGEITVALPTADYLVYEVRGDSILGQWRNLSVKKFEESFYEYEVDVNHEKVKNKVAWSVASVTDESGNEITDFPISSFKFAIGSNSKDCQIILSNGSVLSTRYLYYYYDYYVNPEIYVYGDYTNDGQYVNIDRFEFELDAQGNMIMFLPSVGIRENAGAEEVVLNNLTVKLN